jgi:hypothetical protein
MELLAIIGVVVLVAYCILIVFDRLAGRGPKQVSDGIRMAQDRDTEERIPCPMCAEMILPHAKICRFCKTELKTK